MKKISYLYLQKKYCGKIVALDPKETKVITSGKKFSEIFKKLAQKNIEPKACVFVGPVQKPKSINVYLFSL